VKTWPLLLAVGLAAAAGGGCGGDEAAHGRARVPTGPGAARTEIAQGEMREVLLELQRVHFSRDSKQLTGESRAALRHVAELLRNHTEVSLFIEGHADPRGTPEYNLGLGQQRAAVVADYMHELGIDPERLQLVSYGEERPASLEMDAAGYARDRRVEFRLLRGDVRLVLEEGQLLDDRGNPLP